MCVCLLPLSEAGRERQASRAGCGGLAGLSAHRQDTVASREEQGTAGRGRLPWPPAGLCGGRGHAFTCVESCTLCLCPSKHILEIQIQSKERGCGETESWAEGQGRGRCRLGRKRGARLGGWGGLRASAGSRPGHTPLHSQSGRSCLSGRLALSRNDPLSALILSTAAREIWTFTHKSA